MLENKDLINKALSKNETGFMGFRPIDIEFNDDHIFNEAPPFNRLFIETENDIFIIIPLGSKSEFIRNNYLPLIKSYTGKKKNISSFFVDTSSYHDKGSVSGAAGGNLHCLIKQQLVEW